jgi:hypothetical protein
MTLQPLDQPIGVGNIDGTSNCAGAIMHFVVLDVIIDGHVTPTTFLVAGIGRIDVILGADWLWLYSPMLDWKSSSISFLLCTGCKGQSDASGTKNNSEASLKSSEEHPEHVKEEVEELLILCINANQCTCRSWKAKGLVTDMTDELWITAGFTYSQKVTEEANKSKRAWTFKEIVPEQYQDFSKVFSEQESDRLPEHKPYDHTIDLKLDAPETLWSKVYPMPVNEQEELDCFLEENLRKGYITALKSPMSSPVSSSKRRMGSSG